MNFTAGATSGEEGIHWLKVAHRLAPDAKVVLMTAYGGVNEAVHAMREGAADFVVKPWDNAKLDRHGLGRGAAQSRAIAK